MKPSNDAGKHAGSFSMRIDLSELETFLAVVRLGSFSLAAQHLHITQPSVTSRIQRLENTLGVKLLIRTTRNIKMTPQGEQLFDEASQTLKGLSKLVEGFRREAAQARQRVTVAATQMLAAATLPPIIRAYGEKYSDVEIQLRDLRYRDALASVLNGEADLAVLAYEQDDHRFNFELIREDEMVLIVPSDHPLAGHARATLRQISAFRLMMLEQYEPMQARIEAELAQQGLALQRAMSAANLTTLLGMLDARMGITLLPRSIARYSRQAGHALVELGDIRLTRPFGIVTLRRADPGTAVQSFCQYLKSVMAAPPSDE